MRIKKYLETCVDEGAFPGAAWVIGRNEETLEIGAVGELGRNTFYGDQGLGSVQPDTIYDIASLTKILVTLALMRQFEEGRLHLEDRIDQFLSPYRKSPKGRVTVKELLTHTSVLPSGEGFYRAAWLGPYLLEEIRVCPERQNDRVLYSCLGFILLGAVAESIDGKELDEVLQRRVFDPLGMKDSCFRPPEELKKRIAPTEGEFPAIQGEVHDENARLLGGVAGNAGVFSTAPDLAKVCQAMLGFTEKPFLKPCTRSLMTRNYTAGRGENRGLGWSLPGPSTTPGHPHAAGDLMSQRSFGHTGFTGTSLWIDPDRGLWAVLLTNRIHPKRDNEGIYRVRPLFHNLVRLNYGRE